MKELEEYKEDLRNHVMAIAELDRLYGSIGKAPPEEKKKMKEWGARLRKKEAELGLSTADVTEILSEYVLIGKKSGRKLNRW